jgi:hypothetical protein
MQNLLHEVKITRIQNAAAVGTTTLTTAAVDMQGWDGVLFVGAFGTITDGTPGIKARQGQLANMSDGADLAGTLVSPALTDDNKVVALDVYRPQERYLDVQIVRGGATGAVVDGAIAIQYRGRTKPSVQDATVAASEAWSSPAEGTA